MMTERLRSFIRTASLALLLLLLSAGACFAAGSEYSPVTVRSGGRTVSSDAWEFRGTPYIALDTFIQYADCSGLTISEQDSKIYFDPGKLDITIADAATTDFIKKNAGTCYIFIKKIDGSPYVALNSITQIAHLPYAFDGRTVDLQPLKDAGTLAVITADCSAAGSLSSGGGETVQLAKGQYCYVDDQTEFSLRLRDLSGSVMYVQKDCADIVSAEEMPDYMWSAKRKADHSGEKVNLVWHQMAGTTLAAPQKTGGIDIVAAPWCRQVVDGGGSVTNYCNLGYVQECHKNGYEFWLTITNDMTTSGSTNYTTAVLSDEKLMNRTIAQYLFYASMYDADGINVDYEELKNADRDAFTAFVLAMSEYTDRMGLTLSVCVPPVASWYVEYDYEALGKACDYVCVMTYDENTKTAGSVASYVWVNSSISNLVKLVPNEKILMGVPFYTKLWKISSSGKTSFTNKGFDSAKDALREAGAAPFWNSSARQYYAEYSSGGSKYRIWLEDVRSIANKLTLVYRYDLAGSCCWSHGWSVPEIYDLFESVYRGGVDPDTVTPEYVL